MNEQDKELLLMKDLCARLPYGVFANYTSEILFRKSVVGRIYLWSGSCFYIEKTDKYPDNWNYETWTSCDFGTFKPYLRPMSSMTDKELNELENVASLSLYDNEDGEILNGKTITNGADVDWLIANHFDYRCLIEKGFALPAPEGMYNFK